MDEKFTPEEVLEICRVCGSTAASCKGCPGFREHSCTVDSVTLQARDALAALIEENKRLLEERRWIPTSERLPENGQQVIRYHGLAWNPKKTAAFYYEGDEKLYDWSDVTHWKPMPKGAGGL